MGDFIFNVKGLTAADRAQWEKDNIEKLKGTNYFNWSEEDKTRAFSDASFTNKYKNRLDFNELKKLSPEQKDSLFNLDLSKEDTIDSVVESTDEYNRTVERLNKWHKLGEKAIKDLDDLAKSLNPYYERYLGTEYLPWGDEDKIEAYAKYQQTLSSFGKNVADKELANNITRTIANNQSLGDTYLRGFNNFGATLTGSTLSALGFVGGLVASPALMAMEGENGPTRDLNAFESYLHYVTNNKMTDYGDRIIKRGTLDPRILTSDDPKDDWNRNEIIHTPEEEESNWDYVFSRRFIPEIMATAGFTTAAILEGQALSYIGKTMSGWKMANALNKVSDAESAKVALEQIKNIAKWERRFNAYAIPTLIGTGEGVINALDTYNTTLKDGERLVNDVIYDKAQHIKQALLENPEKMEELGFSNLDENALDLQIMQSLAPEREDMLRKNREEAAEAELLNLGLNSVINGGINVLLKSPMFGGRVKEAVTRSIDNTRVGKFFSSKKPSFTYSNGKVEAILPSTLGRVSKAALETFGEASEEYFQEISDKAAQGAAEYSMENFIARRLNGDAYEAIEDDFANVAGAALHAAGEAAVSKEAIRSAIMGGFSQAIGTATINTLAFHDMKNAKSTLEKIGHLFRAFYRNPFVEELREARVDRDVKLRTAKNIEEWLNSDNNLDRFTSMTGAASWIREMNEHNESGDEFSYKNSKFGKLINDVFMLNDLKGTELYDSYVQQYLDIINTEAGTEEANTIERESGMPLDDAKKHAQSMLDNIDNVNKGLEEVEGLLGKHIDSEVKKALVYGKLSYDNWDKRGKELEKEITEGDIFSSEDLRAVNKAFKGLLYRFKVEALKKELDKLGQEISTSEKNEKHLSKKQKAELKNKKALYKKLKILYENISEEVDTNKILTPRGILSLNPIERYKMLNPRNKEFFTEEQLEQIDALVNDRQLKDANFMQKVEDSARIEKAKELYLNQYIDAIKNPNNLNKLATILRTNVALELLKSKYKYLNDINNKEEFLKELDKSLEEAKDTLSRQSIINIVSDNPFYKEFIEAAEETEDFNIRKENNALYRSLEDKNKRQIEAVEAFLERKKISPKSLESLEAITNNNGNDLLSFIEEFNQNNPDNQVEFDNIGEVIANYQTLVDDLIREERQEEEINKSSERKDTPIKEIKTPEVQLIEGAPEVESKVEKLVNPIINSLAELPEYKEGIEEVRDFIYSLDRELDSKDIVEALVNHEFSNVQASLASSKIIQVLQGNKFAIAEQERRVKKLIEEASKNSALIDILVLNSFKGQPGFGALERFYNIYDIDNFLKSHVISRKDGIFFIYDPALASLVSSNMGDSYTVDDAPIILAIQSNEGNYEVERIKYQPIGVYKGKDNNKKDLLDCIKGNDKLVIKLNEKPIVTTIFKYILTKAPQHIKQGLPNIPIGTVAFDDESNATKERYSHSSKEEKDIFYINLRERILSKIKYVGKDENPSNPTPHIAYTDTDNKVGGEALIDIFISDPENTVSREGKPFKEALLRGNALELFTYNSRLYGEEDTFGLRPKGKGLVNALREFFNNKPFNDLKKGKTLKDINEALNNAVSDYIVLSNREYYKLELVPTGNIVNEIDEYELRLVGPSRLVTDTNGNTVKQEYNYLLGTIDAVTLSDDTLVAIVLKLFLDENNKFRKIIYNGKEEPLVKWNVNFDSFERGKNDKSSGARKHREEVYDDNILTISKTSLKRTVTGLLVNAPNIETSRPKGTNVTNLNNASINNESNNTKNGKVDVETGIIDEGKPGKLDDNTESNIETIVKRIKERAKQLSRTTDEKFYTDGTNNYIRATSIIRTKPYVPFDYEVPSTAIGNSVDLFVRDFFNNSLKPLEEYPNSTTSGWNILLEKLNDFKNSLEKDGFKVISEIEYPDGTKDGVRTKGTIEVVDDKGITHSVKVAGTLDLLAYNPITGKFRIYDMKTLRNKNNVSNQDYLNKWGRQLFLYKKFLEDEYGIEIESTLIIPIEVNYQRFSYTVLDNQLYVGNRKYVGVNPNMLDIVNIDTSKVNFKVKFDVLSENEQQLILGEIPQETTPIEIKESEPKSTPIKKKGKLKAKSLSNSNISSGLKISSEDYKEGSASIEMSDYSFDKLKDILSEEEYKALDERLKTRFDTGLTKEYWDKLPIKLKERNIQCVKG